MTHDDSKRIAVLTTGAIQTTTDNTIKAMMAAVEAAEEKTREMRAATEQYIAEFKRVTADLAVTVNSHVTSCQAAIDSFQEHHLKILNGEIQIPAPPRMLLPANIDEELGRLRALNPPARPARK